MFYINGSYNIYSMCNLKDSRDQCEKKEITKINYANTSKCPETLQEMRVESRNISDKMKELKVSFNKQLTKINTFKGALKGSEKI